MSMSTFNLNSFPNAKQIECREAEIADGKKHLTEFQCHEQLPLGWRVSVYRTDGQEWDYADFESLSQARLCYNAVTDYNELAELVG